MSELTSPKNNILKQSQKSKLVFLLEDASFNKVASVSQSIKGSSVIRAGVEEENGQTLQLLQKNLNPQYNEEENEDDEVPR
jgi:hypothetical protein